MESDDRRKDRPSTECFPPPGERQHSGANRYGPTTSTGGGYSSTSDSPLPDRFVGGPAYSPPSTGHSSSNQFQGSIAGSIIGGERGTVHHNTVNLQVHVNHPEHEPLVSVSSGTRPFSAVGSIPSQQAIQTPISSAPVTEPGQYDPNNRPRSPPISYSMPSWKSIQQCTADAFEHSITPEEYLGIFSLPCNFGSALEALISINTRNNSVETQEWVLQILSELISQLWLTDRQVSELEVIVGPRLQRWFESRLARENQLNPPVVDPLLDLKTDKMKTIATNYAEALAMLEQEVRVTHGIDEIIRWLSEGYTGEFQSFPCRVHNWVIKSILDGKGDQIRERFQLYYKVAKRSKKLHNFSATHAIMSALIKLDQIRIDCKVRTTEFEDLKDFQALSPRRSINGPHLRSLQDVILNRNNLPLTGDLVNLNSRCEIHWNNYIHLRQILKDLLSTSRLVSPKPYKFAPNPMQGFVKKCLINVQLVNLQSGEVEQVVKGYHAMLTKIPPLFQNAKS